MKWKDSLSQWRKDRNITTPQGVYMKSMAEEIDEYLLATEGFYVDKEGNTIPFETKEDKEHAIVDAIADCIVLSANELALMGYDLDLVMKQVVKHISSRKQCPIQQEEWTHIGPNGKWKKDPSQDPSTLYEPDYTCCKLNKAHP